MIIRTDLMNIETDHLKLVDRHSPDKVLVTLEEPDGSERIVVFEGIAAQQVWCQVGEWAEYPEEGTAPSGIE